MLRQQHLLKDAGANWYLAVRSVLRVRSIRMPRMMTSSYERQPRLARSGRSCQAAATLKRWWGAHALPIAGDVTSGAIPVISTSSPELDTALGVGGFLRIDHGAVWDGEFGQAHHGTALAQGDRVDYLDLAATLDPK